MNYVGNFLVVNTSSVFVFNGELTFAKNYLTLNEFFISKNVSVNTIVEIKVGSSMNSLCSVELSCINDILISDFSSYKPCIIHVIMRYLFSVIIVFISCLCLDCFLRKIIHTRCLVSQVCLNLAHLCIEYDLEICYYS